MTSLCLTPITLSDAMAYVRQVHRHHPRIQGGLFAIAVSAGEEIVGVAIVGRPVARMLQDGWTAEVTRVATNGHKDACSMLYGACWRAARAMGYKRLITYTLKTEPGTSVMAANWKCIGEVTGESWNRQNRPRVDRQPLQDKLRWEKAI